jgi:hypothetical protein
MDEDERRLYAEAVLGKQISEFWNSEVGKYVIARSKAETDEIISKIKYAPVQDVEGLQRRWDVAECALIWLNEAILAGKQALAQLENE